MYRDRKTQLGMIGDGCVLMTVLVLLMSFVLFPWASYLPDELEGILDLGSMIGLELPDTDSTALELQFDWLDGMLVDGLPMNSDLDMVLVSIILLTIITAGVASLTGLLSRRMTRPASYATLIAGAIMLLSCLAIVINNRQTLGSLEIGLWITLLLSVFLCMQVFIPRPVNEQPAPQVNFVIPGMDHQFAPRGGFAPAPAPAMPMTPPQIQANAWLIDTRTNHQYPVLREQTKIGRSAENDVVLNSDQVSREHALIHEVNNKFTIYDRASKAGVRVNDQLIRGPMPLEHNYQIVIGDVVLQFVKQG